MEKTSLTIIEKDAHPMEGMPGYEKTCPRIVNAHQTIAGRMAAAMNGFLASAHMQPKPEVSPDEL